MKPVIEPRASDTPIAVDCSPCHTEKLRDLIEGAASKETHLDNARLPFAQSCEFLHCVVESGKFYAIHDQCGLDAFKGNAIRTAPALLCILCPCMIDEQSADDPSGNRKKVKSILIVCGPLIDKLEIRLMHQSRRLQGVVRTLLLQMRHR